MVSTDRQQRQHHVQHDALDTAVADQVGRGAKFHTHAHLEKSKSLRNTALLTKNRSLHIKTYAASQFFVRALSCFDL
jgi:hypothetical protein